MTGEINPASSPARKLILPATLTGVGLLLAGVLIGNAVATRPVPPELPATLHVAPAPAPAAFAPPPESAIPDGPDGDAIRRGKALFENPAVEAARYVGNRLACRNCHLDAGRKPLASPMWAAWGVYPKYRPKNHKVMTMEERIRDCFIYSQNAGASPSGGPPPLGSPVYTDMMAYFHWLATGAPSGVTLAGAGYRKMDKPAGGYDRARGRTIFAEHCAACHGPDGQGQTDADGKVLYPPLWGAQSYNWGAGMARVDRAAAFIKENMPLGAEGSLSEQQAWDVAAWIDSQERPRDPRQTGTVAQAARDNHANEPSYYGQVVDGHLLGTGTSPTRH